MPIHFRTRHDWVQHALSVDFLSSAMFATFCRSDLKIIPCIYLPVAYYIKSQNLFPKESTDWDSRLPQFEKRDKLITAKAVRHTLWDHESVRPTLTQLITIPGYCTTYNSDSKYIGKYPWPYYKFRIPTLWIPKNKTCLSRCLTTCLW